MKKQLALLVALVGFSTASLFGQGQVTMANSSTTLVTVQSTGTPVAVGSTSFQLLAGADAGSLAAVGPVAGTSGFVGRIASTLVNIAAVPPGGTATFQIQAWQSSFGSYALAAQGGGLVGLSAVFTSTTSFAPAGDPPPTPTSLAGKFPGFSVAPIPEPSTIALGLIGAGSLLFLRRKK